MSEIKQKRSNILRKLFYFKIVTKLDNERLSISVTEMLNKFSDYEITESGKYLEWMVKCYTNNGFLYEDLYKVKETLEIFHENKMKLSKEKRDIQQYKTLAELWIEVKKFVEQKEDFLSTNEQKRKEKELAYQETEFLYEDENLRLVAPLTETASKWWGKGTRWCTAAENNNMFIRYFKRSPLIIFDFKDGEKWQLWINKENIQFMDENDSDLKDTKIINKWGCVSNIFKKFIKFNGFFLDYVPYNLRNQELCNIAAQQNGMSLLFIPEKFKDKNIFFKAVKSNADSIQYIPEKLKTEELYELAVSKKGKTLCWVPEKNKTLELCKLAVQQNGESLVYVPNELRTKELCEIAVKNNGWALQYVSKKFKTQELCELAVKNSGYALKDVPEKLKIKKLCEMAVKNNGWVLNYVPKELKTEKICKIAIQQDSEAFFFIPKEILNEELCKLAVQKNGLILCNIPDKLKTKEICEVALKNNINALHYVPEEFQTQELKLLFKNSSNIIDNNISDVNYEDIFNYIKFDNLGQKNNI